jgi:hypothetical protein
METIRTVEKDVFVKEFSKTIQKSARVNLRHVYIVIKDNDLYHLGHHNNIMTEKDAELLMAKYNVKIYWTV